MMKTISYIGNLLPSIVNTIMLKQVLSFLCVHIIDIKIVDNNRFSMCYMYPPKLTEFFFNISNSQRG